MQFEDSILEALHGDMELAACYNTYVDARKRLSDRNKNRGFWQAPKGSFGSSKGKGKSKQKGFSRFRKPLAQRILESECRRCGQKGHWKAECPLNRGTSQTQVSNPGSKDSAFAGTVTVTSQMPMDDNDMILMTHMEDAVSHMQDGFETSHAVCCFGNNGASHQ